MEEGGCLVRLRGLPWSATPADVTRFLDGCNIVGGEDGIYFVMMGGGRATGEAYVKLSGQEDMRKALSKDKCHMGPRYVDVFKANQRDLDAVLKRATSQGGIDHSEGIVRLRGLPFGCSKEEIAHFFSGLMLAPNGITILTDHLGRSNGQAFVRFAAPDDATKALEKHKGMIGRRYIEVFKSSLEELMSTLSISSRQPLVSGGGGGAGGAGHGINHNGLGRGSYSQLRPYSKDDCFHMPSASRGRGSFGQFRGQGYFDDGFIGFGGGFRGRDCSGFGSFNSPDYGRGEVGTFGGMSQRGGHVGRGGSLGRGAGRGIGPPSGYDAHAGRNVRIHMRGLPYSATAQEIAHFFYPLNVVNINIKYNKSGRPTGDADVDFASNEDALLAMQKNRASMRSRYIELFLTSVSPDEPHGGACYGNSGSAHFDLGNEFTSF